MTRLVARVVLLLVLSIEAALPARAAAAAPPPHPPPTPELFRWEYVKDPNPATSLAELEKSPTAREDINAIINHVVGTNGGILIQRFRPQPSWLWRQWYGTVLFHTSKHAIRNMVVALLWCILVRRVTHQDWHIGALPLSNRHVRLQVVDKIWKTLMSLTTFLLTFFVGQAYTFWRSVHDQARGIQGRMNDIHMLMATNAVQSNNATTTHKTYTPEASDALHLLAAKLRVFHLLFWSANARRFRILLTPQGMEQLVQVGYLPATLKEQLDQVDLPPTLQWVSVLQSALVDCQTMVRNRQMMRHRAYSVALEQVLLDQFCRLRGLCATIPDLMDGRMPLAYAHFVQILVDSFLFVAPIAQYPEMGIFSVISMGILTLFYRGLLDLAKEFLDPLDSEDYCEGAVYLNLAVFIREVNAASTRWIRGAANL